MKMRKFRLNPVQQMGIGIETLNDEIKGATHIETCTQNEGCFGGEHTLIVYAFYPDKVGE